MTILSYRENSKEVREGLYMKPEKRKELEDEMTIKIMERLEYLGIEPEESFRKEYERIIGGTK